MRVRALLALALALALTAAAAAGTSPSPRPLRPPTLLGLVTGAGTFRDGVLPSGRRTLQASREDGYSGGLVTASTGEQLTIYVSDAYASDPQLAQRWADFAAWLVHGSELAGLTVYFTPLDQVQSLCGSRALACYGPDQGILALPGEPTPEGISVETLFAHEYGHHVAANRDNAPWSAADWGTKRWGSYENVCRRQAEGTAFPGDESLNYLLNPGEAFAETYRLLNLRRLDAPLAAWNADGSFQPDDRALAAVEQDVVQPWSAATALTLRGTVRPGRATVLRVATPNDGDYSVTLSGLRGTALSVTDAATGAPLTSAGTLCGTRLLRLAVKGKRRSAFSVAVSVP